jgi:putative hydrolase of the HAD superfamily
LTTSSGFGWKLMIGRPAQHSGQLRAFGVRTIFAASRQNQERLRARYISEDMGFSARFDRLYFSCDLGVTKPAHDYYGKIQNDLEVSPNQIFFWDDSQSHVDAARNFGWNAFLYDGPHSVVDQPRLRARCQ